MNLWQADQLNGMDSAVAVGGGVMGMLCVISCMASVGADEGGLSNRPSMLEAFTSSMSGLPCAAHGSAAPPKCGRHIAVGTCGFSRSTGVAATVSPEETALAS
jgi:hypothetical protein